jgi:SpoVK/Ycf46/Vps4 family AAA+-type ATPase
LHHPFFYQLKMETTMTDMTAGQVAAAKVSAFVRARNAILWIVSKEEERVERYLIEAASAAGYIPRTWDIVQGPLTMQGERDRQNEVGSNDPGEMLTGIGEYIKNGQAQRTMWIMRDLPVWLQGPPGAPVLRQLRNLARSLPATPRDRAQVVVILTPSSDMPQELTNHAVQMEWPLPDRAEIADILDAAIESLPEDLQKTAAQNGARSAAIDAAIGLTGEEAQACFAQSIVSLRRIDPGMIASEKKRVIAREKVLEWIDPLVGGLDSVGGLDVVKQWLVARSAAFTPKARAYGLPAPKGLLFVGPAGTGKTLTAKAVSTAWQCPLLRFNFGAMKSKYVGESEQTIRRAYKTIDAVGKCVVWIDEIEKDLQGATSGSSDGGVSADALGSFLSWMQDRPGEAFVIATSNDVSALPPELLRKGRFDEVFFVDLPNKVERIAVLKSALRSHNRGKVTIDHERIANACEGFSGAEIAALVPDALYHAFGDGEREITTGDLLQSASTVVPTSKSSAAKIAKLREWGAVNARPASSAARR